MTHAPAHSQNYLPGFGNDWLLPLYDPFTRIFGIGKHHQALLEHAAIEPGNVVLEIGCGTGNLLLRAAAQHPAATLVGIDPDPKALRRAERKAARRKLTARLDRGFAQNLPYGDDTFDRVLSSFMLHHLPVDEKTQMLTEVRRVLKPGGRLYLMDIAGHAPHRHGWFARRSHHAPHVQDQLGDGVVVRLKDAGFTEVQEVEHRNTRLGRIAFFVGAA